jgi:hypothetical protein
VAPAAELAESAAIGCAEPTSSCSSPPSARPVGRALRIEIQRDEI